MYISLTSKSVGCRIKLVALIMHDKYDDFDDKTFNRGKKNWTNERIDVSFQKAVYRHNILGHYQRFGIGWCPETTIKYALFCKNIQQTTQLMTQFALGDLHGYF